MKRTLTGIVAASMVLGTVVPMAFAATSGTVGGRKAISVNGRVVSNPFTRVAKDSGGDTSYIGVWYLQQAIKLAGGDSTWDAHSKTLNIKVPGVDPGKISVQGGVGSGDTTIQVNNQIVKKVNSFFWTDPAGGSNLTTFMPLWYIGKVFAALGSNSSWDGNNFSFKTFPSTVITYVIEGNANVGLGQQETLSLLGSDMSTPSGVTWSVNPNSGAVIDSHGMFIASVAGTYTVSASLNGQVVAITQVTAAAVRMANTVSVSFTNRAGAATSTVVSGATVKGTLNFNGNGAATDEVKITTDAKTTIVADSGSTLVSSTRDGTTATYTITGGTFVLTGGSAGTTYLQIQDLTNPAVRGTASINVMAGSPANVIALTPNGDQKSYTVTSPGEVGPFTLEVVDTNGNPAPFGTDLYLSAANIASLIQGSSSTGIIGSSLFRTSASGTDSSWVKIPAGTTSVQVWGNVTTAGTLYTGDAKTISSILPTAPTAVSVRGKGGNVVLGQTLNSTNTDMTGTATITAGQATGGKAEFYVGATKIATDSTILAGDTTVTFDLGTSTTADLQAAVPTGGVVTVKLYDAAGNVVTSAVGYPTLQVDYLVPAFNAGSPTAVTNSATPGGIDITVNATEGGTAYVLLGGPGYPTPTAGDIVSNGSVPYAIGANTTETFTTNVTPHYYYDIFIVVQDREGNLSTIGKVANVQAG